MKDRRLCIELIKTCETIKFTEKIEDGNTIGYIDDFDRQVKVLYLEDNIGKYVSLEYSAVKKKQFGLCFLVHVRTYCAWTTFCLR